MGLDDFASAEELEALQTEPASTLEADPDDEDLFDFPDMTLSRKEPAAEAAVPSPEPQDSSSEPSPTEEAPVTSEASSAPDETASQESAAPAPAQVASNYDPELDEDIFNFDELFTPAESKAGEDMIPATDLFEPNSDGIDPFLTGQEEEASEAAPPPEPSSSPAAPAKAPVSAPDRPLRAREDLSPILVPEEPEEHPLKNRMVLLFVGGFMLANAGVMFFAWQASRSFQNTMQSVREELDRPPAVVTLPTPTEATQTEDEVQDQPSPEPRSIEEAELLLAQKELSEGQYAQARLRLFDLLSNRDRIAASSDSIAAAEYMIARTYLLQGEATLTDVELGTTPPEETR